MYIFGGESDLESSKEIKLKEYYFLDTSTMEWNTINMNKINLISYCIL